MKIKNVLLALFASTLLVPAMAVANPGDWDRDGIPNEKDRVEYRHRRPDHRPGGRYELRTVNQWIEGRHERTWVAEHCWEKERPGRRHGHRRNHHRYHRTVTVCEPGHYESRWVPGYYQPVQQWVFVVNVG